MRLLIFIGLILTVGCNTAAQNQTEVSADEFEKGINSGAVQILDVRTAGEFRSGHIKSALQANWNNEKEFIERTASLSKSKPVYIYCLSGPRSSAAAEWLRSNGFEQVVELGGGFSNWKRKGKPVEGMPDVKQMTFEDYQQQINKKEYVLVDIGAEWCPPCRKMEPIINSFLASNKNIFFLKIDGGIHTSLMKQLNAEILPTFILLKNGTEVWRHTGILEAVELEAVWNQKK
jgi:predicted bacteriocin transport accessory protein